MGQSKATLAFEGGTLLEWVIGRLRSEFAELLVSANDDVGAPTGVQMVRDLRPYAGPLAGIEAGLTAASYPQVLAVACDMPLVSGDLARTIVVALGGHDAAVPRLAGRPEPACAAYARSAAVGIGRALERGERRASHALGDLDVRWLDGIDASLFRNVNTPDDYRALLDAVR